MKHLIVFLLYSSLASGSGRPIDRVRAYAGPHKITVRNWQGNYWVEMEDSDIFGVGPTVDEAAEDFMADADVEAHETNRPHLKKAQPSVEPPKQLGCPQDAMCI